MQDCPKIKAALEAVDALPQLQETLGSSKSLKDLMAEAVRRSQQRVPTDVADRTVPMIAQVPKGRKESPF